MALDAVAEFILRPLVEVVVHIAGYLTAYVMIPILTLGHVVVEPILKHRALFRSGERISRSPSGKLVIQAETANYCGFLIWVLIGVGIYFSESA